MLILHRRRCRVHLLTLAWFAAVALVLGAAAVAGQDPERAPTDPAEAAAPDTAPKAPPAFDPSTLPDVVARVNGTAITREQLVEEAKGAYAQLRQLGQSPPLDAVFFRGALDQRIASLLLEAEAKARGIGATPAEIDERLAKTRSAFENEEAFQRSLQNQDLTEESARAELAQEIARYKYIEMVIVPEIEVSEEAVRTFYDQNLESMKQPERVKLRHILIQVAPGASEEDRTLARRRAEEVLAKAKAGEDFATLAREYSDDGTREQGGELPWIQRGQTLPAFEQAAFALENGQLSDAVETPLGFHIIQSGGRQPARVAEFDEVKERIQAVLQTEAAQERLRATVEGLMAKAEVERFAL